MKAKELREMTDVELNKQLKDLKAELFNLRFQHAINQLENPGRIEANVFSPFGLDCSGTGCGCSLCHYCAPPFSANAF